MKAVLPFIGTVAGMMGIAASIMTHESFVWPLAATLWALYAFLLRRQIAKP